ncbi:MAG: hypothetical protein JWO48_3503, partial [Bryobacterales bacterium]|nr:hypothetical protein [Bryobacterales bacterium]
MSPSRSPSRTFAWIPDDRLAVLKEGAVPEQFVNPPQGLLSGCSSIAAALSGLDNRAVEYIADLLSGTEPPEVRVVLFVHATCPTKDTDLLKLASLLSNKRLKVWVLPIPSWGQRCSWVLALRRDTPTHVLWTSSAGDFGLAEPATDEAHLVTEADPIVAD